ncbi:cupin domain-containing protein [Kitasatospora sp. CM 4170]|uniref:Cupin domain-containing protein n=1 Tax=Kitasatospora aburaviensis TaxID=67265 RepID=A0ABW1F5U5_9ACTN|nr:cupin domain-containing protein [Kitasatospora sp. CM 4170]WNM48339.1 cupin domain-containing protein [Kitasatospora sp. CM 4170]
MYVISETAERTTHNASGLAAALAGPSRGSEQVSTWRVEMEPGTDSPVHLIDRDQVWMPIAGTFEFVIDEETALVGTGQALVVPADRTRVFRAVDGRAQALVAMAAGGTAAVPGSDERIPLPWAR